MSAKAPKHRKNLTLKLNNSRAGKKIKVAAPKGSGPGLPEGAGGRDATINLFNNIYTMYK